MINRYRAVRGQTLALITDLSAEDCCAQSMTDASPTKWHLAHTTWFFETFVLEIFESGFKPFNPRFRMLFNSYYESVGPKYARPARGIITRPSLQEILRYREYVDEKMSQILTSPCLKDQGDLMTLVEWGLQHEQQHQELILSDLKHLFFQNPLRPAFRTPRSSRDYSFCKTEVPHTLDWYEHPGGLIQVGGDEEQFCFDNEIPRHSHWLEPFKLSTQLVTNQEFMTFIEDGGYQNPRFWLSEGWMECERLQLCHPLYWQKTNDDWLEFTLEGDQPLKLDAPLMHISYYEADAFARWAGFRLPTEFEWESMVRREGLDKPQGFEPCNEAFKTHPDPEDNVGFSGLFRIGWQWTQSSYTPYPGYKPIEGSLGEYNAKFMVNQQVLRGGACATPINHVRVSYRNFFPAASRWLFSSIRLAHSD